MNELRSGVLPPEDRGLTLAEAGIVLGMPGKPLTTRRVGQMIADGILRRGWSAPVRLEAMQMPRGRLIFARHIEAFLAAIQAQVDHAQGRAAPRTTKIARGFERDARRVSSSGTPTYPDARTFGRRRAANAGRHAGAPGQDGQRTPDRSPVSGGALAPVDGSHKPLTSAST